MSLGVKFAALLIGLLSQSTLPAKDPVQSQSVSDIQRTFRARTSEFHYEAPGGIAGWHQALPKYPAGDLNRALAAAKSDLIATLPADAAPLRDYVDKHFPSKMEGFKETDLVDMRQCGPYVDSADGLFDNFERMNAYDVTLTIDSNRNQANFTLHSAMGRAWSQITRGRLLVWRGEYTYELSKTGQKTITGSLDLVTQPGDVLTCTFVPELSLDAPMPCQLSDAP